ncbi:MAG: hypothetical protein E7610_09110 [Ruminococcaceae bacterium]|nr:hypothetical protein [Oscillospiraceae bacterium]
MNMTPESILKLLTLDQKLAQLIALGDPGFLVRDKRFDTEGARRNYPHGLGGLMVPIDLPPAEIGAWTGDMLDTFAELSPVPPVLMCESLHGILGQGATVFPQSIGMGATFDPALMERVGAAIGREAKALGIRLSLAPDLDLGREPRWGRIEETYGEAPYLVGEMGAAYVRGLLADDGKYAATVKHFAAHGSPEAGINLAPVNVTPQELEDKYLPPFKKALDAGAKGVMPAYSTLNGIPCHSHPLLMKDVLRERWGFEGVVVSDFGAVNMLLDFQRTVTDPAEAEHLALEYGIDLQVPGVISRDRLKDLIQSGEFPMELIDRSVLRIIQMKLELGLFDRQKPSPKHISATVRSEAHRTLAREAARKSMVLMKNHGVLPLKSGQRIAVIGPNAASCQFGDYSLPRFDVPTPMEAIRARAEKDGGSVTYACGCDVCGSDRSGFAEAVALAGEADAVICIIGGKSMKGYGVGWGSEEESILTCGEGCDMHDLTPGGPQLDLCRALIATGKPVTVVMIDGRPETLFDVAENCAALVAAWYPGEEGSTALAELLFGDVNFSGKLPVTFPRHVGQLPITHDRVPSGSGFYHAPGTPDRPGRDYVFGNTSPAFEFGFGLGYSEIAYSDLSATATDEGVVVTVTVANKGKYPAEEAVLTFIRDEVATLPQPQKKLVNVHRVSLAPDESATLHLPLPTDAFTYTDYSMNRILERGWFTIMVGGQKTRIFLG